MLNIAQKLMQKPKDSTIRIVRIIVALLLIAVIYFGWNVTYIHWGIPEYVKYVLYIFPVIGLIRGLFDPGLFRKKIWKWTIFGIGVTMVSISLFFIEDVIPSQNTKKTDSINLGELKNTTSSYTDFTLSTDTWFAVFGWIFMFVGFFLNNKNITSKNEKYGEKITKIRI